MESQSLLARADGPGVAPLGKYLPFARIGDGGMADVFLAVARGPMGFQKLTVIKRLRSVDDPKLVQMFVDEARLSARLNHPNIVQTYDVGEADGRYFIAMEYLEGRPLGALLEAGVSGQITLSQPVAAFIAAEALKGLHYAHELTDYDGTPLGIVHRDVSPHNVFVTYAGDVKLLDFGIAKAQVNLSKTETGVLKGKLRYMAPEQAVGNVDRRGDVFAVGIILWEMLARRRMFQGDTLAVLHSILNGGIPALRSVRPDVDPELETIVMKALERDPAQRYATAEAMRSELDAYLRRSPERVSDASLAALMSEAFSATRETVKERIRKFVAKLPPPDALDRAGAEFIKSADSLPALQQSETATLGATVQGVRTETTLLALRPDRKKLWLLAGVVGLVVIGGVVFAQRSTTSVPAESAEPLPPPPAPKPRVRLTTAPPSARVEWNNQFLGLTPGEFAIEPGQQTLTISLAGYEPETLTVAVPSGTTLDKTIQLHELAPPKAKEPAPAPKRAPVSAEGPAVKRVSRPHAAPAERAKPVEPQKAKIRIIEDE